MDAIPFVTVNDETITLSQALKYLKATGGFQRLLGEVLRQHLLGKELEARTNIQADTLQVDQAIMDFRTQSRLTDADRFQKWLATMGNTYEDFRQQIDFAIRVEKLKTEVSTPQIEEEFNSRKSQLDRVVLSRIITEELQTAETCKEKILTDSHQFESLAREHSLPSDRPNGGKMGAVQKGKLPEAMRQALESANVGELVGPIELGDRYCLCRIDEFLPATLDDALKIELQNQIFERWIQEKLTQMTIKLEVK
jgi:parvulin-like peptidyl-prolyl isomerase